MHKVNITYPNGEIRIRYFNEPPTLDDYFNDRDLIINNDYCKWANFEFVELSEDGSLAEVERIFDADIELIKKQHKNRLIWYVRKSGDFYSGQIYD